MSLDYLLKAMIRNTQVLVESTDAKDKAASVDRLARTVMYIYKTQRKEIGYGEAINIVRDGLR